MRFFGSLRATASLRDTPIGAGIRPAAGAVLAVLALALTALDLELLPWRIWADDPYVWPRGVVALAVLAPIVALALARSIPLEARLATLGLRRDLLPSLAFWRDATLAFAVAFAVLAGSMLVVHASRHGLVWPPNHPPPDHQNLWPLLVEAPLYEELIYRWVLVTALVAVLPGWAAVVISGIAFGYLHVVYGVPAPNNVLAGFAFGWVYLKSGNIAAPVAMHVLGNAAVHLANVATYAAIG